tara:strand:+ start:2456 stop:2938 length:483 start_codon:yes stop_codon:yes gene_type:complete
MAKKNKTMIALLLMLYAVFGIDAKILDYIPNIPLPIPTPEVVVVDVDKPSGKALEYSELISGIVTDKQDRKKLAIFNHHFASRILKYNCDSQSVNDVYALAGKTFFQTSLVDKYDNLAESLVTILSDVLTDENHIVNEEERAKLSEYFNGIAWGLAQKGK